MRALNFLIGVVIIGGAVALLVWTWPERESPETNPNPATVASQPTSAANEGKPSPPAALEPSLSVFAAASLRPLVEDLAAAFEQAHGVRVHANFGPSQTLVANLRLTRDGDLFFPADSSYLDQLVEQDPAVQRFPLAEMHLVLAVPRGNPRQLSKLADIWESGVRFGQASPETAAAGLVTRRVLTGKAPELWDRLHSATLTYKPAVSDVANDLRVGALDAAILWNVQLKSATDLDAVELPELVGGTALIEVGFLPTAAHPRAAKAFTQFAQAPNNRPVWEKHGFRPWTPVPAAAEPH